MEATLLYCNGASEAGTEALYAESFGDKYEDYRRQWRGTIECEHHPFPVQLDVEVVDACNLRCRYCFRHEVNSSRLGIEVNKGTRMSPELYEKIMREAQAGGTRSVNLGFSGECLIREDLPYLINRAYEAGIFDIRILTNGLLLTERMTEKLLDSKLTLASFSVDAGRSETYKKLKGKDGLDKVHKNIRHLYRRRKERGRRFPLIRATYYMSEDGAGERDRCIEELSECVDMIYFKEFLDLDMTRPADQIAADCRMPFQRLAIYANGDVAACCTIFYAAKMIIGNANEMTLQEIWDSPVRKEIRDRMAEGRPVATCVKCLQTY